MKLTEWDRFQKIALGQFDQTARKRQYNKQRLTSLAV